MAKIKIDSDLFLRAKKIAEVECYSSVDEFVTHIIEEKVSKHDAKEEDEKIAERLRGLGYID